MFWLRGSLTRLCEANLMTSRMPFLYNLSKHSWKKKTQKTQKIQKPKKNPNLIFSSLTVASRSDHLKINQILGININPPTIYL